jgi:hypothetical protein
MPQKPLTLSAVLAVTAAVAIAGCGSGTGPSTAVSSGASNTAKLLVFSECMRSHGVPDFPDPGGATPSGSSISILGIAVPPTIEVKSPAVQSALSTCQKQLTAGAPRAGVSEAQKKAALQFARCIRTHGIANFPDPVFRNGRIGLGIGAGDNPNSPALIAADKACGNP